MRPPGFEYVSSKAIEFAQTAMHHNWSFEWFKNCATEAWVIAHEEALKTAREESTKYGNWRMP